MGRPAKKRRFSSIIVNGDCFQWRFDGKLHVLASADTSRRGQRLVVDWGWVDWCEPEYQADKVRGPKIVTPSFVRLAIEFGVQAGWTPHDSALDLMVEFTNGVFSIESKRTDATDKPKSQ